MFERLFETLFSFPGSETFGGILAFLRILSLVLIPVFAGSVLFVIIKLREFRPPFTLWARAATTPQEKFARGQWQAISARFESGLEADWRTALIEADDLANEILERIGFSGESLAERMEQISSNQFPEIQDLKEAHRVRTNIENIPGYKLYRTEAESALKKYQKGLEALEVI